MSRKQFYVPEWMWPCFGVFFFFSLAWVGGCGKEDQGPVTAETSHYQVADDNPAQERGTSAYRVSDTGPSMAVVGDGAPVGDAVGSVQVTDQRSTGPSPAAGPSPGPGSPPAAAPTDRYRIPDDRAALLALLQELPLRALEGSTDDERFQDFIKIHQTRIKAADRLLEIATEKKDRIVAARAKLDAMRQLIQYGVPDVEKQARAYCHSLMQHEDPDLVLLGRLTVFALAVEDLNRGEVNDEQAILDELKSLVVDGAGKLDVFVFAGRAARSLHQAGFRKAATEAYRAVGEAFQQSDDARTAADAAAMLEQAQLLELDYDGKLKAMMLGEPDSVGPVAEIVRTMLSGERPGRFALNAAAQAAQLMEMTDHAPQAGEIFTLVDNAFKDHPDKELAQQAATLADNGRRRAGLIGKPFSVEGKLPDGSDLDWSQYQGKVVLVDFWASWCGPCWQQIQNVRRYYERYRDKGFEVVGVSVDNDVEALKRLLAIQPLPWVTIVNPSPDADPNSMAFTHPLAVACGVDAIPFVVLVGRDGNVNAIHVRGETLGQKLAALLGPADGAAPDTSPDLQQPAETQAPSEADAPSDVPPPSDNPSSQAEPTGSREAFFVAFREEGGEESEAWRATNPYAPPGGLSPAQLIDFLLNMQEKPKAIQARPGFAAAVVEAADRILAADAKPKYRAIAAQAKFDILHGRACQGDDQADRDLAAFVQQMKDDKQPAIAANVQFFLLERRAIDADKLAVEKLPELLSELQKYFANQKLTERHLRMASSTVRAINRLADADQRETYFQQFGKLFAASASKELARYGKKIAKGPESKPSDLIGKPLELAGLTALGTEFDWAAYRNKKAVLVMFWATWCGPCRQTMPQVKALYEQRSEQGFDVVGVCLDRSQESLAKHLEENAVPWTNLVGKDAIELGKRYGVHAIPTLVLVDQKGIVVAVDNKLESVRPKVEELLQP